VKIATWNVNGIRAREAQVREWIEREQPDVVCLQEVKAPPGKIPPDLALGLAGYWCYWHTATAYSGVGLHVRRGLVPERPAFRHPDFDAETRIAVVELGGLEVASVYVPNGGKDYGAKIRFLEALDGWAAEAQGAGRRLVVCGDVNVARAEVDVHLKERDERLIGQRPEERALLGRILGRGLTDLARALDQPNEGLFTWWAPWRNHRQRNIGWRIDYVLMSEALAGGASSCRVLPEVGTSDHAPLVATLD
jgi:exodeoxyribonuclease-3